MGSAPSIAVSGIGVIVPGACTAEDFARSLMLGMGQFGALTRSGRGDPDGHEAAFIGAEIDDPGVPPGADPAVLRGASLTGRAVLKTVLEAWVDAKLDDVDPERIGLIIGGSNVQQRESWCLYQKYRGRSGFVNPRHGFAFMDTDLCGICTEVLPIRGPAFTVGGASASGQLAVIQAAAALRSGQADVCIAVGALTDLSFWELQALRSLGAMGTSVFADQPARASRPFDRRADGFIFAECCAALVIEPTDLCRARGVRARARLQGWGMAMAGNRDPAPSAEGEKRAVHAALQAAGITPDQVDYVNAHGTGSPTGDLTEVAVLRDSGLSGAAVNATKSITGHGLCAAGAVELAATILQLEQQRLHPNVNLEEPISDDCNWVGREGCGAELHHAISLSFGFGGVNTAVCVSEAGEAET